MSIHKYIFVNICKTDVWNRGMEQRYGTDPSSRYGTGVWNGCVPGRCSGPSILTCTHIYIIYCLTRDKHKLFLFLEASADV